MCGCTRAQKYSPQNLVIRRFLWELFLFSHGNRCGSRGHPPNAIFFVWLAIRNKCWTADRLQRKGLPHPMVCPLCDQEQETILHLLCSCSFARQFWHIIFSALRIGHLTPTKEAGSFVDWWDKVQRRVYKQIRKGIHSLIILGTWCLWLHRNKAVFDDSTLP
jgi:hypothetical protein